MSTRALRKLQREQEEEKQLSTLNAEGGDDDTEVSEEEESIPSITRAKIKKKPENRLNAFQMLEQGADDDDNEQDKEDVLPESPSNEQSKLQKSHELSGVSTPQSTKPKRKRKRKAKDKVKEPGASTIVNFQIEAVGKSINQADEIDRALEELDLRNNTVAAQQQEDQHSQSPGFDASWEKEISKLLAVDSKNLNPTNEMKSLFGSIALERTAGNQGGPDEEGRVDLETALNGRHSPASKGKELGSLAKRRNIFMQGQENWPLATSGGLGMEVVKESEEPESRSDSTAGFGKHYKIVHNTAYQDTQRQFRQAVDSMSADAMIHLLVYNPYHIAALLQVAEIAKHQGDHSTTGDLLERVLFTFGRSVHSTFGVSVREGRARLRFDEVANRELYLAIWRYLQNLEMRGTWRTAFEWSKLLLSFNILSDPYGITHALDQYALRGRQHDAFIELCSETAFGNTWSHLPNMQISLALAYHRASQPKLARQKLALAMHRYPYMISHLCSTLEISPLPKSLWGVTPSTDAEKLYTELYVTRGKDLWATPETTALLVEVAETLDSYSKFWKNSPPAPKLEVSLEDARHVLLLDIPNLIALIPRNFRSLPTAQYDVLPPPSSTQDAGLTARAPATADGPSQRGPMGFLAELVRAASRGFLGAGTAIPGSETNRNDLDQELDEEDTGMNNAELFNITLADANLSEENRIAILAALAADDSSESDSGTEQEDSIPRTTQINPDDDIISEYRDEERPPVHQNVEQPINGRRPASSRLAPLPDMTREETDEDVNAPLPPDEHRPRPQPASSSPPPDRVVGLEGGSMGPPAPTVEDGDDDGEGGPSSATSPPPPPPHALTPSTQPQSTPIPASYPPIESTQSIQRYLLTTGLQTLLESQTSNKNNHNTQDAEAQAEAEKDAMTTYITRLRQLRHRDREWTLAVLKQRIGVVEEAGISTERGEGLVTRIRRALG